MSEDITGPSPEPACSRLQIAVLRPRLAIGLIGVFATAKLIIHFVTVVLTQYGIHRDEFLYLAMGQHLRFWCMDFPPAIAVLAKVARSLFGDTLFAVRFFPAIAGTFLLVLTGLNTRELGGGRFAQGLAMFALLLGSLFLRPATLFQPVVWDQLWWTLGFFALIKIAQSSARRWWLLLGVAGGLGLLTKFSIGFFALGVLVAMLLSSQRVALATRWPYLAVLVALLVGSASIVGQIRLDFPVVIHMRELQTEQLQRVSFAEFLAGQVLMLGPTILLAVAGLGGLLAARALRPYRVVGWTCVASFLVLLFLHGKAYYIGPIYPTLFAAGAATIETIPGRWRRVVGVLMIVLIAGWGAGGLPFGLPIVPPPQMARYAAAWGGKAAVTTNRGTTLALPQDYADMLGWEKQVSAVARVYESLPPDKRAQAVLVARNYGEAGALEFFGPRHGLPRRVLLPGNHLLWPPPADKSCDVAVTLGISTEDLGRFFLSVNLVTRFDNSWMVEEERNVPICVAETPYRSIDEAWSRPKR
jgi:4-amino-4-deoxy-L-arabinose transferase-like glycosyltransferase